MELHQVRYFVALYKSRNFTRAAKNCRVTQPALTRGIQRLEKELGGALFRRERNLTQLTELGRLMRPHMEQMLAMAETAIDNASRFNKNELASLRIGLPPAVSADVAAVSLSEVARRMPMLEIKLSSAPQSDMIVRLLEGELDGAFLVHNGELPERLNTWLLYTEDFQLALPSAHTLAKHEAVPLWALQGHALVACVDCSGTTKLKQQCDAIGMAVNIPFVVDSYEQAQHMVVGSLGVALLPERLPLLPPLISRRVADAQLSRTIVLAVVNGRTFSPALNAFVKLVRARDFRLFSKKSGG
jgi:DNA-binding transcriptional LysR family regulator